MIQNHEQYLTAIELAGRLQEVLDDNPQVRFNALRSLLADMRREIEDYGAESVAVRVGNSCLTRDLVWCGCGRGLSLTGKWLYCPSCGRKINQESYAAAVEQAIKNGARKFRDTEVVEAEQAVAFWKAETIALNTTIRDLQEQLERERGCRESLSDQLASTRAAHWASEQTIKTLQARIKIVDAARDTHP